MQSSSATDPSPDVIVVGGGLAGLIATNLVAQAGRSAILLGRSNELGGRAATHIDQGFHFNLGPHALYCRGHAFRLLRALEIPFKGGFPVARGGLLIADNATFPLPLGIGSLLTSRLLTAREKLVAIAIFGSLGRLDSRRLDTTSLSDWIEKASGTGNLSRLLKTLFRVSSYVDDADQMSAGAALDQFKLTIQGNVWYLDGGWQTLVNGLRDRAIALGAILRTGAKVRSLHSSSEGVIVRLINGEPIRCRAAVLSVAPQTAVTLLDLAADTTLVRWSSRSIPVRAACLDVALTRLPRPDRCLAFGLERPLYFSVHSASARLAPPDRVVLHIVKYLGSPCESSPAATQTELEDFLDQLQPGWRDELVTRRFLPAMAVASSLPCASEGGLQGRPSVTVPGLKNVFLAGDWVGPEGLLADASAASAAEASRLVLASVSNSPALLQGSLTNVAS